MGDEKIYRTTDLYQASALVASGVELIGIEDGNYGNRKQFMFKANATQSDVVQGFVNGTLNLNVQTFLGAWRRLRRALDREGDMRYERQDITSRKR